MSASMNVLEGPRREIRRVLVGSSAYWAQPVEGGLQLDDGRMVDEVTVRYLPPCNPSKILGLERGTLKPGAIADITIIDPLKEWVVTAEKLQTKSKNTPFLGWQMKGAAAYTIVKGKVVYTGV